MRIITFDPPNDDNEVEVSPMPGGVSLMLWGRAGDAVDLRLLKHEWEQFRDIVEREMGS